MAVLGVVADESAIELSGGASTAATLRSRLSEEVVTYEELCYTFCPGSVPWLTADARRVRTVRCGRCCAGVAWTLLCAGLCLLVAGSVLIALTDGDMMVVVGGMLGVLMGGFALSPLTYPNFVSIVGHGEDARMWAVSFQKDGRSNGRVVGYGIRVRDIVRVQATWVSFGPAGMDNAILEVTLRLDETRRLRADVGQLRVCSECCAPLAHLREIESEVAAALAQATGRPVEAGLPRDASEDEIDRISIIRV
jgi:hypothetical protein